MSFLITFADYSRKEPTEKSSSKIHRLTVTGEISNIKGEGGGGGGEELAATNKLVRDSKDVFKENLLHFRRDGDKQKPH